MVRQPHAPRSHDTESRRARLIQGSADRAHPCSLAVLHGGKRASASLDRAPRSGGGRASPGRPRPRIALGGARLRRSSQPLRDRRQRHPPPRVGGAPAARGRSVRPPALRRVRAAPAAARRRRAIPPVRLLRARRAGGGAAQGVGRVGRLEAVRARGAQQGAHADVRRLRLPRPRAPRVGGDAQVGAGGDGPLWPLRRPRAPRRRPAQACARPARAR